MNSTPSGPRAAPEWRRALPSLRPAPLPPGPSEIQDRPPAENLQAYYLLVRRGRLPAARLDFREAPCDGRAAGSVLAEAGDPVDDDPRAVRPRRVGRVLVRRGEHVVGLVEV